MLNNKIKNVFSGPFAVRVNAFLTGLFLLFVVASCEPSKKQIEKKHEKYVSKMPSVDLKKGDHAGNAEKLADLITWEMAADIDSLIKGLTTPKQKYNLVDMYCNTAVTTAIRDALNKANFQELYGFDFFEGAKRPEFQGGARFLSFLKKNKNAYDVAAKTIKFKDIQKEDYENMARGSVIFYRGSYITAAGVKKKPYSHTQMSGGKGFSDDVKGKGPDNKNPGGTKFMPSEKGETITINAYSNLYRWGSDNIEVYEERGDVMLDEVVVVDMALYLEVLTKQKCISK